ncbi:hypothetical protein Daus18300_014070 [Diaporthe australafricana]|uniref:2-dehydropantoate 2-reductase n=1 Tax=Diaporthe australafricana TaxID=127596 RepID=A0ABR3VWK9_9PEZI
MTRVLIFGTGSIGAVYALLLQKAGADVTCVCRSTYEFTKLNGFTVESTIFGSHNFHPKIVRSVHEAVNSQVASTTFDFIAVCTKAVSGISTLYSPPSLIRLAVEKGHTSIVIIQNGLGVERVYHEAFPNNTIISGVTYLPVTQTTPGTFSHAETQRLHLGVYPAHGATSLDRHSTKSFASLIKAAGAHAEIHEDVQVERWKKLVANATWNPICALSRCRDLEFLQASPDLAQAFIIESMREVVAVAVASGYGNQITEDTFNTQLERSKVRKWPGVEPSMLADIVGVRPMEVEGVLGELVKVAKEKGVDVPRLETLYLLLRGYDWVSRKGQIS